MYLSLMLSVVLSTPPQVPPPRQAPPIKADCGCSFGEICRCGEDCRCAGHLAVSQKPIGGKDKNKKAEDVRQTQQNIYDLALDYDEAYKLCLKTGKPMVCFVGTKVIPSLADSAILAVAPGRHFSKSGYPDYCVIVAVAKGGQLIWRATLATDASEENIRRALMPEPVREQPMQQSYQSVPVFAPQFAPQMFAPSFGGRGGNC